VGKIYGIHEWTLRPGVSEAEFLQTVSDVLAQPHFPGWRYSLLRGDRGPRAGTYTLLIEVEDVVTRDRYTPALREYTDEATQFLAAHPEIAAPYEKLVSLVVHVSPGTDYEVVAESM
jgi:hypothetical protein